MPRKRTRLQINEFNGGFNTELNLMKEQPNICRDELNMLMLNDASRAKRYGFDLEPGASIRETALAIDPSKTVGLNTFLWENAGGVNNTKFLVVQLGSYLAIHNAGSQPITTTPIYTYTLPAALYTSTLSFASVDGILVMVTGEKQVYRLEYNGTAFTLSQDILRIRDLFGVAATADSKDLTLASNLEYRPLTLPNTHLYNLRNQTFNVRRWYGDSNIGGETVTDPIKAFYNRSLSNIGSSRYPSNSDNVNQYTYAWTWDDTDRTVLRYSVEAALKDKIGSTPTPNGYFIIDALERGASRLSEEANFRAINGPFDYAVSTLPVDKTPNGATTVCEFAGRVWYAGFSGNVEGGDLKSPRLSSYLLFSRLVKNVSDVTKCYQESDPTSMYDNALVDTDGGFIRVEGAYNIHKMLTIGNSLFVFAENGVWRVTGSEDTIFRATGYQVDRVSTKGAISANSIVFAENGIVFWSEDGIYAVARTEVGGWTLESLSQDTIAKFYKQIPLVERKTAQGAYDSFTKKIHWVYAGLLDGSTVSKELVFNAQFKAFSKNSVDNQLGVNPKIARAIRVSPYTTEETYSDDTHNSYNELAYLVIMDSQDEPVTNSGVGVTNSSAPVTSLSTGALTFKYSLGYYRDKSFFDWSSLGQRDYDAYLVSGSFSVTSGQSVQDAPYIYTFFRRTEQVDGPTVSNYSSCLMSSQWDWANTLASNKWSMPKQVYRYTRQASPVGAEASEFDTGYEVIKTKNRVRGRGKSLALRMQAETGKAMHVCGWAFFIDVSDND